MWSLEESSVFQSALDRLKIEVHFFLRNETILSYRTNLSHDSKMKQKPSQEYLYSRTSPCVDLSYTGISLIYTVHLDPEKCPYILSKNNL